MSLMMEFVNATATTLPIAKNSVQAVITSPPYWNLRDYGVDGQIGVEELHDCLGWATKKPCGICYVCKTVEWASEVWRVLKPDGTFWLNIGDSHNNTNGFCRNVEGESDWFRSGRMNGASDKKALDDEFVKVKDLYGMPWRISFALQAYGWYLRSDIIWSKPNPMPESATDRPIKSHEHIFLFSKQQRYYSDMSAIREPAEDGLWRKPRDVWSISVSRSSGGHFATFNEEIPEKCILASTRKGDIVCDPFCGSGTTGIVARRLGRNFVGIELNREYIDIAMNRSGRHLLESWENGSKPKVDDISSLPLFSIT